MNKNQILKKYPPPRTEEQQIKLVAELKDLEWLKHLEFQKRMPDEYFKKVYYIKTFFSGNFIVHEKAYHPQLFVGTKKEYDDLNFKYYEGRESEFKIIASEYLSKEQYNKKYPLENCK